MSGDLTITCARRTPCVFCDIIAGDAPGTIVERWPDAIALAPLGPVVAGHVLIIPRRHVTDFTMSPEVSAATMRRAAEFAGERYDSANVITSKGRAATQSVRHLHVHVVPRAHDDGLMVPWGTVFGDDPQAPHWCRVAQGMQDEIDTLRARRSSMSRHLVAWLKKIGSVAEPTERDRVAAELERHRRALRRERSYSGAVRPRPIAQLEQQLAQLDGTPRPRRNRPGDSAGGSRSRA